MSSVKTEKPFTCMGDIDTGNPLSYMSGVALCSAVQINDWLNCKPRNLWEKGIRGQWISTEACDGRCSWPLLPP